MFDWIRFVLLARILLNNKDEEYVRSAISRYYYGVFGIVRRYLKNKSGNVHYDVFRELRKSNDLTEKEISKFFNKLRNARNQADYDDDFDVIQFKKFLNDNEKNFEIITEAMFYFRNNPKY